MGRDIKVNTSTARQYTSKIVDACGVVESSICESPSEGTTKYPAYVDACSYASDIGENVSDFVDKVREDCKNVNLMARDFKEYDAQIASGISNSHKKRR